MRNVVIGIILLLSCRNEAANKSLENEIVFKLNPTLNKEVDYEIETTTIVENIIGKETTRNSSTTTCEVSYTFKQDSSNFSLDILFRKFNLKSETPDESKEFDASDTENSEDPMQQKISILRNALLHAKFDSTGRFIAIEGVDSLLKQAQGLNNNAPIGMPILTDDFFQKIAVTGADFYPNKIVRIGDTWSTEKLVDYYLKIVSKREMKLLSIKNNIAKIEVKGMLFTKEGASITTGYNKVGFSLTGDEEGYIKINLLSGLIEKCELSSKTDGVITYAGRSIPIKVETNYSLSKSR